MATETLELDAAARIAAPGAVDAARRLLGLSHEPLAGAALSRAMNALAEIASELDRHSLGEAAGARSDTAALLRILEDPAALARLQQTDPLADARLRWVRDRERLLHAEGEPLTSAAVGQLLGVSRQAVAKARAEGRLLGLPTGRGTYVYPSWQFGRSGVLHGFRRMREAFASAQGRAVGHDDPWLLATFMVSPNSRLNDESPLAVLQRGRQEDVEAAVCTAAAWGEQSAA